MYKSQLNRQFGLFGLLLGFLLLHSPGAEAQWISKSRAFALVPSSEESLCTDSFTESIENMKAIGADIVSIVVPWGQNTFEANTFFPYFRTPSDEALRCGIDKVLGAGMRFGLNLVVDAPDWRANIDPENRDIWFARMGEFARKYAREFAQPYGAEHLSLGTEMYKVVSNVYSEENADSDSRYRWPDIIADVRAEYQGIITYSAQHSGNRSELFQINDLLENLDVVGVSAYWQLNATNKQGLLLEWARIETETILPISRIYGKPIAFLEVGYRPCEFTFSRPYDSDTECDFDGPAQALAWEALLEFFAEKDYLSGILGGWAWEDDATLGGEGDTRYTPWGKEAATVIAQFWQGDMSSVPSDPTDSGVDTPEPTDTSAPEAPIPEQNPDTPNSIGEENGDGGNINEDNGLQLDDSSESGSSGGGFEPLLIILLGFTRLTRRFRFTE